MRPAARRRGRALLATAVAPPLRPHRRARVRDSPAGAGRSPTPCAVQARKTIAEARGVEPGIAIGSQVTDLISGGGPVDRLELQSAAVHLVLEALCVLLHGGSRQAIPSAEPVIRHDLASHALVICERSEEHTSELQSQSNLVCRLL